MRFAFERSEPVRYNKGAGITTPRYGNADEIRKVRRLVRFLATQGFAVHSIAIDGEDTYIRTRSERAAVCEVFEWDALVTLRFTRGADEGRLFGVLLVQGNRDDIISDYTCDSPSLHDASAGTFTRAMDDFFKAEESREV